MADQENKRNPDEIHWSLYGREARAIRSDEAFQQALSSAEQQPAAETVPEETDVTLIPDEEESPMTEESADAAPAAEASLSEDEAAPDEQAEGDDTAEDEVYYDQPEPAPSRRRPLVPPQLPRKEPPEPPKKKRRRVRSAGVTFLVALLYVVSVLSISLILATVGWRFANDVLALNKTEVTTSVVVEAGDSVAEVAQKLKDGGLIEYPFLFEVFSSITGKAEKISSGTYELNTNMDYSALLTNISASSSSRETVTVTIPEGYTVEEIFALLEKQGVNTVSELQAAVQEHASDYAKYLPDGVQQSNDASWLEGYLFPDTYNFYKDGDAHVVLTKMLWNYSQKFTSEMKTRAERLGYSQHEIMIIASIIEKETDGEDQADIASVIYNRLETDNSETQGKLQMDSTIQYILEERKETLTDEDLAIDSPYNTYLYTGLPAGTICNPGMEAINAALYPNSTTYYYFILGSDGTTHFFSSYSDFNNYRNGIEVETTQEDEDFLSQDDAWEEQEEN